MVQEHFNYEVWNSFVALPYCFLDFIIYSPYNLPGYFFFILIAHFLNDVLIFLTLNSHK